jgi:trans-aconitate 2-methyltransferase
VREAPVAPAQDYVRWLAAAKTLDVWTTDYVHLLPPRADGEHPVVAWTRGAALTPFEAALDAGAWAAFLAAYRARVANAYPPLADGRVPFVFRRRFVVATR